MASYLKMGIVGRMSALLTIDGVRTISLTVPLSSFSGVTSIGSIVERCCVRYSKLLCVCECRVCPPIWISYSRAA
jgi:hypothetical protein